jgi:hypothetical protein
MLVFLLGMIFVSVAKHSNLLYILNDVSVMHNITSFGYALAFIFTAAFILAGSFPFNRESAGIKYHSGPVGAFVTIAPVFGVGTYMLIRLVMAINGSMISNVLSVTGAISFAGASILALGNKETYKKTSFNAIAAFSILVCALGIGKYGILRITLFAVIQAAALFLAHNIALKKQAGIGSYELYKRLLMFLPSGILVASRFILFSKFSEYPIIILLLTPGLAFGIVDMCLELADYMFSAPLYKGLVRPDMAEKTGKSTKPENVKAFVPLTGGEVKTGENVPRVFACLKDSIIALDINNACFKDIYDRIFGQQKVERIFRIILSLSILVIFGVVAS